MSKMSELAAIFDELVDCGKALTATAEKLCEVFSSSDDGGNAETTPAPASEEPAKTAQPKAISLEEVRAALAEKSRFGKTVAVKTGLTNNRRTLGIFTISNRPQKRWRL